MIEIIDDSVIIKNKSNMVNNKKERNLLNISLEDYSKIVRDKNIEKIFIEKQLYINNTYFVGVFLYEKIDFLNMNIYKGKTKNYLRVKFNGLKQKKLKKIEKELLRNQREVA